MWLIFGLGNPGPRYALTRHNVGVMVLHRLAEQAGCSLGRKRFGALVGMGQLAGQRVLLAAPQTFMNASGRSVAQAARFFGEDPRSIIVIHDDVDLAFGRIRIKAGGGHGGHKGLRSIIEHLGCADFARVRVGIGRPPENVETSNHVLSPFQQSERAALGDIVEGAALAIPLLIDHGIDVAMNRYNGRLWGTAEARQ